MCVCMCVRVCVCKHVCVLICMCVYMDQRIYHSTQLITSVVMSRAANPVCEEVGCGEWKAPLIPNPEYKGKWSPPMIENPNYKVGTTYVHMYVHTYVCVS